jgi:acyl CoA:acetate/3-ketoacid CoA transferase alpha subunit
MQKGTHMAEILDSILRKDVAEAKAALARHGIVIIRQLETDLEPAMIAEAKNSIVSSPEVLSGMSDEELDKLMR